MNILDELGTNGLERFKSREQDSAQVEGWYESSIHKHSTTEARRVVIVEGESVRDELQHVKYDNALRLMAHFSNPRSGCEHLTIAEWRDGKICKQGIDGYMRDNIKDCSGHQARYGADYTEICSVCTKMAAGDGFDVVVTTEPSAFLRMGCQSVDNNSCYRAGHECELAPLILADNYGTFVAYIKKRGDDKVIARCWGIESSEGWCFTNIYARGVMTYTAAAIYTAALRVIHNTPDARIQTAHIDTARGCYLNGDGRASTDATFSLVNNGMVAELNTCAHCCEACIDPNDEEALYVDGLGIICYGCRDDFIYCDCVDTYLHCDDVTTDMDGEYIPTDRAVRLYDDEYVFDEVDTVVIMHGDHEGEYALCDDDDLRYTPCCNEAYIEGSL